MDIDIADYGWTALHYASVEIMSVVELLEYANLYSMDEVRHTRTFVVSNIDVIMMELCRYGILER